MDASVGNKGPDPGDLENLLKNSQPVPGAPQAAPPEKKEVPKPPVEAEVAETNDRVEDVVGEGAEIGPRPESPIEVKMRTSENRANAKIDQAMALEMTSMRANTAMDLISTIDWDEAEKRRSGARKLFLTSVVDKFRHNLSARGLPKKEKRKINNFKKRVVRARSIDALVARVEAFNNKNVTEMFRLAIVEEYQAFGYFDQNMTKAYVEGQKLEDEDGEEVDLKKELAKSVDKVDNLYSHPVAATVLRDMLAHENAVKGDDDETRKKFLKMVEEIRASLPAAEEAVDPLAKQTQEVMAKFIEKFKEASSEFREAGVDKKVDDDQIKAVNEKVESLDSDLTAAQAVVTSREAEYERVRRELAGMDINATGIDEVRTRRDDAKRAVSKAEETVRDLRTEIKDAKGELANIKTGESSKKSRAEAEKSSMAFLDTVKELLSNLAHRLDQDEIKGRVKEEDYKGYKALKDAYEAMAGETEQEKAASLMTAFGDNALQLQADLVKLSDEVSEKRKLTAKEFSLALLQKRYIEAGYSEEMARSAAIMEYVRREQESKMIEFRQAAQDARSEKDRESYLKKFWNDKIVKNTEYITCSRAVKLQAIDRELDTTRNEQRFLEGLKPEMTYAEMREYLMTGHASRETLTSFMFGLAGFMGGRKLSDGKFLTYKNNREITLAEGVVRNIGLFLAEDNALESILAFRDQREDAENKEVGDLQLLTKVLDASTQEQFKMENKIAARSLNQPSYVYSREEIRAMRKMLNEDAQSIGKSYKEWVAELEEAGFAGLGDFLHSPLHRSTKAFNVTKKLAGKTVKGGYNLLKSGVENRGHIAKNAWWAATLLPLAAVRGAGRLLSLPGKAFNWVARKSQTAVGRTSYAIGDATVRIAMSPFAIAYAGYKGVRGGFESGKQFGKRNVIQHMEDSTGVDPDRPRPTPTPLFNRRPRRNDGGGEVPAAA